MIEIRIHGRGGQGVKKSAMVLARAFYLEGYKTQDFAIYGAERRGAPVISFVRADKKEINTRGYIFEPDYILVLDGTLDLKEILKHKKKTTKVLVNSHKTYGRYTAIDATHIALENIGTALGANIVLLGAFIAHSNLISLNSFKGALRVELKKYPTELINKNILAAENAFKMIKKRQNVNRN